VGQDLLVIEAARLHSDTPHSVGIPWTSDKPDPEASLPDNEQHSQQTDIHTPEGIRIRNPSKRAAAHPHIRPRDHWARLLFATKQINICVFLVFYLRPHSVPTT